ncbi:hypothetical protein ACUYFE_08045 [Olegusella massiliensis]|uniref:hypothetical protein n=1 Tax=Olegusella massiliensis TaxID=1776381 RepID=UPI0040554782
MAQITAEKVKAAAREPLAYFSHDCFAADDMKCRKLLLRGGYAAYGRWWRICELMGACSGHHLAFAEDDDREILRRILELETLDELNEFILLLADIELISPDALVEGEVASERMDRNAETTGIKRAAGREGGKLGGRPKKIDKKSNQ